MDERAAAIAGYWDAAAPTFDDEPDHGLTAGHTRLAWARLLESWMPGGTSVDVLDVGCGTGSLSLLLAEAGHRVPGVDLGPAMVERAHRKLAVAGLPGRFVCSGSAAGSRGVCAGASRGWTGGLAG